jgi:TPR repeat protein
VAGNSGHAMAMNMVGRCHELGTGTDVDLELAAAWYRKAAWTGLDWGLYNYAQMLRRGHGVKPDRAQALMLYHRAAALGHAKSMNLIGRYYDEGWDVERDPAAAIEWYRKAAIGGDFRGQTSYASTLAARGELAAAAHWLRRAALTATPAFLQRLAVDLAQSPHRQMREIAAQLGARATEPAEI